MAEPKHKSIKLRGRENFLSWLKESRPLKIGLKSMKEA
jgi:hypothetical protein